MSEDGAAAAGFKPKKSVALSGVIAGNTAICTVGRSGNDLHYRGYDILDIAESCEFEEIAYLLIHEKLPESGRARRLQAALEGPAWPLAAAARRARADPGDGAPDGRPAHGRFRARLRSAGRPGSRGRRGARDVADRLVASHRVDALLLAPLSRDRQAHRGRDGRRLGRRALPAHAARQAAVGELGARDAHLADPLRRARIQRLDLHRARHRRHRVRHAFLHHRRDRRLARAEARRRQRSRARDPAALCRRRRRGSRHPRARRGEGSHHRLRPSRVHRVRPAQRRHQARGGDGCPGSPATSACSASPSASSP